MLLSLQVKNFAIIDNINIDFKEGMTVLTGETGAGKSLIIDAIGLLFGKRASSDLVRFKENKATIEGVFTEYNTKVIELLKVNDIEYSLDEFIIIKREIYASGKSIAKINNTLAPVSVLNDLSEVIGDIHSQFDVQTLVNPKNYLEFLNTDEILNLLDTYKSLLNEYKNAKKEYDYFVKSNNETKEQLEFLTFQAKELKKANLQINEEEELKEKLNYLNNFEEINTNIQEIKGIFEEKSVLDNIYLSLDNFKKIAVYDKQYESTVNIVDEAYYNLMDVVETIKRSENSLDYDSSLIEDINLRLSIYSNLKRKYKKNTHELIEYLSQIEEKINNIDNFDFKLKEFEKKSSDLLNKVNFVANEISKLRLIEAKIIEKNIINVLKDLMLSNTIFQINFIKSDVFLQTGIDKIDFLITFNKGEPLKSLSKTASGGELSRFMLALKTLVSKKMNFQTLIFDEIDSGVSGKIAFSIASKIKKLSENSQILCVTHLPQVASIADNHLHITKEVDAENRTITKISEIVGEERINEIALMISNGVITDASFNLAKELLNKKI
ncbi:MAG TPA: DNA repair protein RecN [Acholeplasmataceae bacterium]|nr:DNA repair protein RecN [Acholeplasmataceae bacterium]